jgi:hypothetical protein
MDAGEARAKRVQLLSTVLLAVAAVATAWCRSQASGWIAEYRAASDYFASGCAGGRPETDS